MPLFNISVVGKQTHTTPAGQYSCMTRCACDHLPAEDYVDALMQAEPKLIELQDRQAKMNESATASVPLPIQIAYEVCAYAVEREDGACRFFGIKYEPIDLAEFLHRSANTFTMTQT